MGLGEMVQEFFGWESKREDEEEVEAPAPARDPLRLSQDSTFMELQAKIRATNDREMAAMQTSCAVLSDPEVIEALGSHATRPPSQVGTAFKIPAKNGNGDVGVVAQRIQGEPTEAENEYDGPSDPEEDL